MNATWPDDDTEHERTPDEANDRLINIAVSVREAIEAHGKFEAEVVVNALIEGIKLNRRRSKN